MTGNLSPSDLPEGNIFKPCHGKSSCSRANRDVNVIFREKDRAVASKFLEVFEGDLKMATKYSNPTKVLEDSKRKRENTRAHALSHSYTQQRLQYKTYN